MALLTAAATQPELDLPRCSDTTFTTGAYSGATTRLDVQPQVTAAGAVRHTDAGRKVSARPELKSGGRVRRGTRARGRRRSVSARWGQRPAQHRGAVHPGGSLRERGNLQQARLLQGESLPLISLFGPLDVVTAVSRMRWADDARAFRRRTAAFEAALTTQQVAPP